MDSFELNKMAGAVLGTLLFAMVVSLAAEAIFHQADPETPGYIVEVPEEGETAVAEAEEVVPLPVLLAAATVDGGEGVAKKCAACHSFDQGGANKVGPNLWNIVNGSMAHLDDFNYSGAMSERADAGGVWGFEELDAFLANPKAYMDGTSMAFAGLRKPEDRADMIVYLRSLSDSPVPLPEVAAAEEPAAEEASAEEAPAAETETEAPADNAGTDASTSEPAAEAPAEEPAAETTTEESTAPAEEPTSETPSSDEPAAPADDAATDAPADDATDGDTSTAQ